ncbi:MAG: hypothetical protein IKZ87_00370, partial [Actinomycetaceae bacterium]|nr:hypothetical protein [Actinomycetaceae bacterium]
EFLLASSRNRGLINSKFVCWLVKSGSDFEEATVSIAGGFSFLQRFNYTIGDAKKQARESRIRT